MQAFKVATKVEKISSLDQIFLVDFYILLIETQKTFKDGIFKKKKSCIRLKILESLRNLKFYF